jgi:hypothetical protein
LDVRDRGGARRVAALPRSVDADGPRRPGRAGEVSRGLGATAVRAAVIGAAAAPPSALADAETAREEEGSHEREEPRGVPHGPNEEHGACLRKWAKYRGNRAERRARVRHPRRPDHWPRCEGNAPARAREVAVRSCLRRRPRPWHGMAPSSLTPRRGEDFSPRGDDLSTWVERLSPRREDFSPRRDASSTWVERRSPRGDDSSTRVEKVLSPGREALSRGRGCVEMGRRALYPERNVLSPEKGLVEVGSSELARRRRCTGRSPSWVTPSRGRTASSRRLVRWTAPPSPRAKRPGSSRW